VSLASQGVKPVFGSGSLSCRQRVALRHDRNRRPSAAETRQSAVSEPLVPSESPRSENGRGPHPWGQLRSGYTVLFERPAGSRGGAGGRDPLTGRRLRSFPQGRLQLAAYMACWWLSRWAAWLGCVADGLAGRELARTWLQKRRALRALLNARRAQRSHELGAQPSAATSRRSWGGLR
jgi:hypothetical protein